MNQTTRILRTNLNGFYTSIIKHASGLFSGLYELGISMPAGLDGNEGSWNVTLHASYDDAYLMARVYSRTFALYLEDENPQRLADEATAHREMKRLSVCFRSIPKEAVLTFPEGMPHNRRWVSEDIVLEAIRGTFKAEKGKTQKFVKLVSDWVLKPGAWKDPVRVNAYLLDEFEISWVKAIIIWYHGVEPVVEGQFISSPGYGA